MEGQHNGGGPRLSEREEQVLRLVALGHPVRRIAEHFGIAARTVETHRGRAQKKAGLRNRVDIVRYAYRQGWFAEGEFDIPVPDKRTGRAKK